MEKIIFECADSALSRCEFLNKQKFYQNLETSYGVKPQNIGSNYEVFHTALKNRLGVNHYIVERVMLRIMKERTKNKVYAQNDEITAFMTISAVYLKESAVEIEKAKKFTNLKKYTKHLEQKVKEADDRMRSAERMIAIGETAAMVGHDLRNPLQAIAGDLYLVNEELKDMQEGKRKTNVQESLASIQENVLYISKIISDLQDYARPLRADCEFADLSDLVAEIFQTITLPDNVKLEITIKNNLKLRTDASFIRRILTNLANNAIQAMPEGGNLTVTACKTDDTARITVADTGKGIPEEVKQKIFKPLVTTKAKGQGFGLAVVKRLVEALHGTVAFESQEGKGTKFIIELPLKN